jgi:uncharacterized membrane protein YeaQ/YmgE (transglycosylase-associated protein family)
MMHYIYMAVIGLIAGGIAKMILPGNNPSGWIVTAVLGIAGSFLANYLGQMLGLTTGEHGHIMGLVWSVGGAVILLAIYHFIQKASAGSGSGIDA